MGTEKKKKSLKQLQAEAEKGQPEAQVAMALISELGLEGEQDLATARKWWQDAAQQGTGWAQHELSKMLEKGEGGPQDPEDARAWREKAAGEGFQEVDEAIKAHNIEHPPPSANKPAFRWAGKTILLVEDSKTTRGTVSRSLHSLSLNVIEAENGVDGLRLLIQNPEVAMVIADVHMPKLDGLQMTEKIRNISKFKNLPVVVLTSENRNELVLRGRSAGVTGWLLKPCNLETIRRTVQKVL